MKTVEFLDRGPRALARFGVHALLVGASATATAAALRCTVEDGAYRPPGTGRVEPASGRDPTILGTSFLVDLKTGIAIGGALFNNAGQSVELDSRDGENVQIAWRNQHRDLTVLLLAKSGGSWTFTYFGSWQGLMLAGRCHDD